MRNQEVDRSGLELALRDDVADVEEVARQMRLELSLQIVNACASDVSDVEDVASKMLDDCSDDAERQEITRALTVVHAFDCLVRYCLLRAERAASKRSRLKVGPPPVLGLSGKHLKYPTEQQLRRFMLDCVRYHQTRTGVPETWIGRDALHNPASISQIAAGVKPGRRDGKTSNRSRRRIRNIKINTFYDLMAYLDGHWRHEPTGNEQWPNCHFKYPTDLIGLMLDSAQRFQDLTDMPPSEIGRLAIRDAAFLGDFPWRNLHLKTFETFMTWLDKYWPTGTDKRIPRIPCRRRDAV